MKNFFDAYHLDPRSMSERPIMRKGYFYIGALYPKNEQTGERIALVFWSEFKPVFLDRKVFKLDVSTFNNPGSESSFKTVPAERHLGAIILITDFRNINSGFISGTPYKVKWTVFNERADKTHFNVTLGEINSISVPSLSTASESFEEIPCPSTIDLNLTAEEKTDFEEIIAEFSEDEQEYQNELSQLLLDNQLADEDIDLNEIYQLLYDEQLIAEAATSYEEEVLQLIWDEERENMELIQILSDGSEDADMDDQND